MAMAAGGSSFNLGAEPNDEKKQTVSSKHSFSRKQELLLKTPPAMSSSKTTKDGPKLPLELDISPVCIFPDQIAQTTQVLTYRCSTCSRRHPVILNILDQPLLHVRSKTMTMTRERQLRNAANNQTLMTIHRQIWTAGPPYYQFMSTTGVELLRLTRRWQCGTSRMVSSFINTIIGQLQHLTMDGDCSSINATVYEASTHQLLAEFRLNLREWKQTYTITIHPGVDVALICALVVCFDDREGHDFHIGNPRNMKLAWQKDREHSVEKKRQIQQQIDRKACPPAYLDGAVTDLVRQRRRALNRGLHRPAKRFKGPGRHLRKIVSDQDLHPPQNRAEDNAVRAAGLAAGA
jgi:hypothetical protein